MTQWKWCRIVTVEDDRRARLGKGNNSLARTPLAQHEKQKQSCRILAAAMAASRWVSSASGNDALARGKETPECHDERHVSTWLEGDKHIICWCCVLRLPPQIASMSEKLMPVFVLQRLHHEWQWKLDASLMT
jgi:hypothetical protein